MKKYNAVIEAQISALQAWNEQTRDDAEELVENLLKENNGETDAFYTALDNQAYGNSSIEVAKKKIEERKNDLLDPEKRYDTIIDILRSIHDQWVAENNFKIWRGNWDKTEQNMTQHLPTELIGITETAKDLMFLAPFLNEMGIECGEMKGSDFIPNKSVEDAYQRAVDKFAKVHHVNSENLASRMKYIIAGYQPLKNGVTPAKKLPLSIEFDKNNKIILKTSKEVDDFRHEILYNNTKLLARDVIGKNGVDLDRGLENPRQ